MDLPGQVQSLLGDEESVAARVPLGGDDVLYVTQQRTIIYRADGLLSDESVESFPHDAERVEVSESRRKAKVRLLYGRDGEQSFAVPKNRVEEVLHPVLAGVLNAAGVTEPGETVTRTYRFSELTLVVTSARVVKHVGAAVWDEEYEEIGYEDVTGLSVEEGSVASQLVIETTGRPQRIKAPNDEVRDVRERVEAALLAYHDAASYEEFESLVATGESDEVEADAASGDPSVTFESDLDPIELSTDDDATGSAGDRPPAVESPDEAAPAASTTDAESTSDSELAQAGFEEFETAVAEPSAVEDQLRALREAIERQQELLSEQRALLEELTAALSRDR